MNILGIDTSGGTACAALLCDGLIRGEVNINYNKTHSQVLMPMVDVIKSMTELDLNNLDAIAVANGPGSFTGLRIGSATAKGLGLALNIPIIPVPSLEVLAYRAYGFSGTVCPIMDARRSQVYTAIYEYGDIIGEKSSLMEVSSPEAVPIEDIAEKCNEREKPVIFLGDGVPVYKERLKELIRVPLLFAPAHMLLQSGAAVAERGRELFEAGVRETAGEHKPVYLRKPQAERERLEKEGRGGS